MANVSIKAQPAFSDWPSFAGQDLEIETGHEMTIASFAARKGRSQDVMRAIKARYHIDLPVEGTRVDGVDIAFLWYGPEQWLAQAKRNADRDLERELAIVLGTSASVVDHSDGRAMLTVSGAMAPAVLAKGVALDLDPRVFKTGSVAITQAAHIGIVISKTNDAPTFEITMARSFADSFAHWLFAAAQTDHSR